ncbi:metalloregulator ArsR/SmtB family transcription factor [Sporolactobacillus shoreicorticis]|uniref:ArsR/SmtB family transcription factor n=1 Tax=Sporolactobacillus shoreicorticis TaxID=1923877 RepID=A0ABW5S1F3_9BACL|nr:metalloregulator ArsR/SmtB family transcription factor [Sporolactobacillus shoreicorticis]MCO7126517.1 metalloregulator ArsR/SmtB family transcription factor [Sporolactobacillus shoreicorticis]
MNNEKRIESISHLLKIVGDKNRLKMLAFLKKGERCVCEFVDLFDLSQPAISQHLKKMRTAGLINERKQGTWVYYRLNDQLPSYVSEIIQVLPLLEAQTCDCQTISKSIPLETLK